MSTSLPIKCEAIERDCNNTDVIALLVVFGWEHMYHNYVGVLNLLMHFWGIHRLNHRVFFDAVTCVIKKSLCP